MAGSTAYIGAFVIIAEFEVKPGRFGQCLQLAKTDARHSVAVEPGCRQFDVTLHREQPNRVMLYEVDDDRAACQAHFRTPHPRLSAPGSRTWWSAGRCVG